ncbi:MAG: TIGR01212 family radical SAM protein [Desulfobulbaceae bacterium]|nr:TIGR01212 family radical SAM protein [Desulfobulbaceae bacterium]
MTVNKINLFSQHYRRKYGQPVGKISLSLGQVCPNRRFGGCIYCAPVSFTPYYLAGDGSLAGQLARGRQYLKARKFERYFAYFQQETSTVGPLAELVAAFREAAGGPNCVGLIISTRPDCIDDAILQELAAIAAEDQSREVLIELGLQSAHEQTLKLINRNHSFQDFVDAAQRVKAVGLALGVHLILGLPGEDFQKMLVTVQEACRFGLDALKFHHLQVIKNTPLERIYQETPFTVYGAYDYLAILARLLAHVPSEVVIHRLWSSSKPEILLQPLWHGLRAQQLHEMLAEIMGSEELWQGKFSRLSSGC